MFYLKYAFLFPVVVLVACSGSEEKQLQSEHDDLELYCVMNEKGSFLKIEQFPIEHELGFSLRRSENTNPIFDNIRHLLSENDFSERTILDQISDGLNSQNADEVSESIAAFALICHFKLEYPLHESLENLVSKLSESTLSDDALRDYLHSRNQGIRRCAAYALGVYGVRNSTNLRALTRAFDARCQKSATGVEKDCRAFIWAVARMY